MKAKQKPLGTLTSLPLKNSDQGTREWATEVKQRLRGEGGDKCEGDWAGAGDPAYLGEHEPCIGHEARSLLCRTSGVLLAGF
eukprot:1161445-Pelagomonas_calceolata.AAC.15